MASYELVYSNEHENHVDDDGRSLEELLDENEYQDSVRYVGNRELVETKFGCPDCDESFDEKDQLNGHMSSHTDKEDKGEEVSE